MAGACPPSLSIAVANAGGMGACGALLMQPEAIKTWAASVRAGTNGGFQLNLWIPDPPPVRDPEAEGLVRAFLANWGPEVTPEAGDGRLPDFAAQCEAMLEAGPSVISSIMGVFPVDYVARLKARGIRWFATATTVAEARTAEAAGADAIVAQGMEAGGHRGAFEAARAETGMVGLFSLLPGIVDAVRAPVIAAGGIADARGVATAPPRRFRRADRHRLSARPGSGPCGALGRGAEGRGTRGHDRHPRLLRPRWPFHRQCLCPRRHRARRACARAVSSAEEYDGTDA